MAESAELLRVADDTFISYTVPGNHLTMLAQPHVEDLAWAINAELRRRP
jgi:thioesterase domain-containing protein